MRSALDLFAGCGGMTYGLRRAGFRINGALEVDELAARTFCLNHPNVPLKQADIRKVDPNEWMQELGLVAGDLDLLAGCPPCQGFSRLRTLNGLRSNRDRRNRLIMEMARFVASFQPKAVMMENVPGLQGKPIFSEFIRTLRACGYFPTWDILDAADYGVPQHRRRLILVAGRGFNISFGKRSSRAKTVRMAIGNLERPGNTKDLLHEMKEHRSQAMREWIAAVPKNGGSRKDLPAEVQRHCHQKSDGFSDVYGRMAWDKPAPTITTGCFNPSKGRFLHPDQNRNITMREAALLQSFPKSFQVPPGTFKTAVAMMLGNALPPVFVTCHAKQISGTLARHETKERRS